MRGIFIILLSFSCSCFAFEKARCMTAGLLAKVIIANRNQQIKVLPGYDGVYGVPILGGIERAKAKQRIGAKKAK